MQLEPPRHVVAPEDAPYRPSDLVSRMGDVELLAELGVVAALAGRRADRHTAGHADELFAAFYTHRTQNRVPAWLWERTRAFVRAHAP